MHKIKPLEDEQNRLESNLRSAQSRMKALSSQLEGVDTEVATLRNRLNQVTVEAAQIEVGLKHTAQVLSQSEQLLNDLSSEFSRWKDQLGEINSLVESLPVCSLVAAAYIVYCGGEVSTLNKRNLLNKCFQVLKVKSFDVLQFLDCDGDDELFVSVKIKLLTPLIIDPARKIISKLTGSEITNTRNHDWFKVLELGLRFGRTVIIDDFSKINLALLSILRHEIYGDIDTRNWLYVGDKRIEYNQNFKLFLVTQYLDNEIAKNALFNVINLSPSESSMTENLLSIIIDCRKPELENEKLQLEKTQRELQTSLKDLEAQLLQKLTSSSGNLLNDTELIKSLKTIKVSAKKAEQSLLESKKLKSDLNQERMQYSALASFASKLYFLTQELYNLNCMYHFGISEFENVFRQALQTYKDLGLTQLTQEIYYYISRGLFNEDKVIFQRFLKSNCPEEAARVEPNDNDSLREFVRSTFGSKSKIALIMTAIGCDPSSELQEIANEMRIKKLTTLSMGADVISRAEQIIRETDGAEWICFTNLHLVISWLPNLTQLLQITNKFTILVTECHEDFPVSLLNLSVKFAYESAPGLHSQLKRLFADPEMKTSSELKTLAYLHGVCCERRHFVPQGWTKAYEFGFSDFRAASRIIRSILQTKDQSQRPVFIRGLLESVVYGGKLDTRVNENILRVLIKRWFSNLNNDSQLQISDNEISLLGLAANSNNLRQVIVEERLMRGLRVLQKAAQAEETKEIKRLQSIWRELNPNSFNEKHDSQRELSSSPLESFFVAENRKMKNLLILIDSELANYDEEVYDSLLMNETPDSWLNIWPNGSQKADGFIREVANIQNEILKTISSSTRNVNTFNISCVLHPTTLLNTLKQQASRELNVSIDWLNICCAWGNQSLKAARATKTSINGIIIEGALFDGRQLQECQSDSPLQSPMPTLTFYYIAKVFILSKAF